MKLEDSPVICRWTAEELNDKAISFVPSRNGVGPRVVGKLLAAQVGQGLYIQISLSKPGSNSRQMLYWLNQDEAKRIHKNEENGGSDFILS